MQRIRSRISLWIFDTIFLWIIGPDVLRTPYGRLLEQIVPHQSPEDRNPYDTLSRLIREREAALHTMQQQHELIRAQQENLNALVTTAIDKLTADVAAVRHKLETKASQLEAEGRPTSWQRLDEDVL